MFEIETTDEFDGWLETLKDRAGKAIIVRRIDRVRLGNFGNSRAVGEGVSELKVDFGPGYRVYFKQTGKTVVLLLCGGDKSTQENDIKKAKAVAANL